MKVRTCRYAGISDVSDNLPLIYVFTFFYAERTHMRIACIHTVLVADNNVISKTCIIAARYDLSVCSRHNRIALPPGRKVNALVNIPLPRNRMKVRSEHH